MKRIALVVQGPWGVNTEKIVAHYLGCFDTPVVVSTYRAGVPEGALERLSPESENLHVHLLDPPAVPGLMHRNSHRISAYHGLKVAERLGCPFAVKTRTDHVFKSPQTLAHFAEMFDRFPLDSSFHGPQRHRLIVGDAGTTVNLRWGKFHVSDFWLCGETATLLSYFDTENDLWKSGEPYSIRRRMSAEPEFAQLWMRANGITARSTSQLLRERFVVINNDSLHYAIAKEPIPSVADAYTDWAARGDPLTVRHEDWLRFVQKGACTLAEEMFRSGCALAGEALLRARGHLAAARPRFGLR
jgi:hypothetical protein